MKRVILIWPVLLLPVTTVAELPSGFSVSGGSVATPTTNSQQMQINQSSDRAVVRWDSFNIGPNAGVTFQQPGREAATLNIVNGSQGSTLAGSLSANGSVFLINPHGITVTPTGTVNTGGAFVASTLTGVNEASFMGGGKGFEFTGSGGEVVNEGAITAQDVLLLGGRVDNSGTITAATGRVALGAATKATLDLEGDGFLQVLMPSEETGSDPLVSSSGPITAGSLVEVRAATAHGALRHAVNLSGDVQAGGVSGTHGAIVFDGGAGGKLTVSGTVDATPETQASRGGDIRMVSAVVDVDLGKVKAGKDGHVMLGANSLQIDINNPQNPAADQSYLIDRNVPGVIDSANGVIKNLLRTGTDVTLHANHGLGWNSGLMIGAGDLAPEAGGKAGNLHLLAGGGLSMGGAYSPIAYSTYNGDWTLSVNAPNLFGIPLDVPTDPNAPPSSASISLYGTEFVNDNGHLTLEILNGERSEGIIQLPFSVTGAGLTARIDSRLTNYDVSDIRFLGDIDVAGDIRLAGNLRTTAHYVPIVTLSGNRVVWETETTDRLAGGLLRFMEGGALTRYGFGGYGPTDPSVDAVRLALGSDVSVSRQYGDDNPGQAALAGSLLRVADHNTQAVNETQLADLLKPGSIKVAGPGGAADVGEYQLTLSPEDNFSFSFGGGGEGGGGDSSPIGGMPGLGGDGSGAGFWVDLTGGDKGTTVPLAIVPRTLTATLLSPEYTYGSPVAALRLQGVVNGDDNALLPVGTVGGQDVSYQWLGDGYALPDRTAAGTHNIMLSGLSGSKSGNYLLDVAGLQQSLVEIVRRAITSTGRDGSKVYGDAGGNLGADLHGLLAGDQVSAVAGLLQMQNGNSVALTERTAAGTYQVVATDLAGKDADNYVLSTSGNVPGTFTIEGRPISWAMVNASSVYGSFLPGNVNFSGVLFDDEVTASVGLRDANGSHISQPERASVGNYASYVTGIDNTNYVLANSGNTTGNHQVTPRTLNWQVSQASSVYGDSPQLGDAYLYLMSWDQNRVQGTVNTRDEDGQPLVLNNRSNAGRYLQVVTGLTGDRANNYVLADSASSDSSYRITPRPLQWHFQDVQVSTYGNVLEPTVTFDSVLTGDDVRAGNLLAKDAGNVAVIPGERTNAGFYSDLSVTGLAGDDANNYVLANNGNTTADWRVLPRPVQWNLDRASVVYGDATNEALSGLLLEGLLPNDGVSTQFSVRAGSSVQYTPLENVRLDVGTYSVAVGELTGPRASNYVLQGGTAGELLVTPRPVTWRIVDFDQVYGNVVNQWPLLFGNLAYDDNSTSLGAQVTLYDSNHQAILHPFSPGSWVGVGTYGTGVSALSNPNYVLANSGNEMGNITITPRPLNFTMPGGHTVTYGRYAAMHFNAQGALPDLPVGAVDFSSLATGSVVSHEGSTLSDFDGALDFSSSGYIKAGYYNIVPQLTGRDAGNYQLVGAPGLLTITPKNVPMHFRPVFEAGHQEINGKLVANYGDVKELLVRDGGTSQAFLNGDHVAASLDNSNAGYSGAGYLNAGDYQLLFQLVGDDAGNYQIENHGAIDLVINRRQLDFPLTIFSRYYGNVFYRRGDIAGLLDGDRIEPGQLKVEGYSPVSDYIPIEMTFLHDENWQALPALDVGSYQLSMLSVSGPDAGNYIPSGYQQDFDVIPLPVTLNPVGGTVRMDYGDPMPHLPALFEWTFYDVAAERQVTLPMGSSLFGEMLNVQMTLPEGFLEQIRDASVRTREDYNNKISTLNSPNVGTYDGFAAVSLQSNSANGWRNFELANPGITSGQLIVDPRLITAHFSPLDARYVYGGSLPDWQPTLSGVLSGDWVKPVAMVTGSNGKSRPVHIANLGQSWVDDLMAEYGLTEADRINDHRLPAGNYHYWIKLVDSDQGNYRLEADKHLITVNPRELQWMIPYSRIQYGNFKPCDDLVTCNGGFMGRESRYGENYGADYLWVPATEAEAEWSGGVLKGDQLQAVTALLDLNGLQGSWADKPPVGLYFHVVEGLAGADAGNYVLASEGNVPGMLTVEPQWVAWNIGQSMYTPETGFKTVYRDGVANELLADLRSPDVPDTVKAAITLTTEEGEPVDVRGRIEPGHYFTYATGLGGKGSANFRLLPASMSNTSPSLVQEGVLTVFTDTRFGMDLVDRIDLAPPPPDANDGGEDINAGDHTSGGMFEHEGSWSANCGYTSCKARREDQVTFGSGDINLTASHYVEALAKVGAGGITLEVNAEQRISIDYQFGPGYINQTLLSRQQAALTVGKDGAELSGTVEVSQSVTAGARGDLGGGAEGDISASAENFARAQATMKARIEDGKLQVEQSFLAGAGSKVSVNGSIGGETGSVNAGAVAYSPGSVGFEPSFDVGFSDGRLQVNFGIGAAIGLFGGGFELGFEIDFNKLGSIFADVASAIGESFACAFGNCPSPPSPADFAQAGLDLKNDPVERYQYLVENPLWTQADKQSAAYRDNKAFFDNYTDKVKQVKRYLDTQQEMQKTFQTLLEENPVAAISYASNMADVDWTRQAEIMGIRPQDLAQLGIQLSVSGGNMTFSNIQ